MCACVRVHVHTGRRFWNPLLFLLPPTYTNRDDASMALHLNAHLIQTDPGEFSLQLDALFSGFLGGQQWHIHGRSLDIGASRHQYLPVKDTEKATIKLSQCGCCTHTLWCLNANHYGHHTKTTHTTTLRNHRACGSCYLGSRYPPTPHPTPPPSPQTMEHCASLQDPR